MEQLQIQGHSMDSQTIRLSTKNPEGQNRYSVSFEAALMFSLLLCNEAIGVGPVNYLSVMYLFPQNKFQSMTTGDCTSHEQTELL